MKLSSFLFLNILIFSSIATAEQVEVRFEGSYESRTLEVEKGQTADIDVYLESAGRPVDGYTVALIRHKDSRILRSITSAESGHLRFLNVPPLKYKVKIIAIPKPLRGAFVSIGDVRVSLTELPVESSSSE